MVIQDGDLGWPGRGPTEDNTPLVIDADRVGSGELSFEEFESVARGNREVAEFACLVHLDQFPEGDPCDGGKATVGLSLEQLLGIPVCEGLDHAAMVESLRLAE